MMPISEIKLGNIFQNPLYGSSGVLFYVEDINIEEKMVKVAGYSSDGLQPVGKPVWKSNRDRMFSESWKL